MEREFDMNDINRHCTARKRILGLCGTAVLLPWIAHAADRECTEVPLPREDFTGRGTLVTWDCARFEGEFVRGQLRQGRVTFADGDMREGNFVDGVLTGPGKLRQPNGTLEEGNFVGGMLQGDARLTYPDGRVYQGQTVFGRANGLGRVTYPDGTNERGFYTPEGLIGLALRTLPDGTRVAGEYRDGKPFGNHVVARPDGTGEIQSYAWGGQRVARAGDAAPGSGATPAAAPEPGKPVTGEKDKTKKKASDVADEVNRAVRGLKGILGGG